MASMASPVSRLACANDALPSIHGETRVSTKGSWYNSLISWLKTKESYPKGANGLLLLCAMPGRSS